MAWPREEAHNKTKFLCVEHAQILFMNSVLVMVFIKKKEKEKMKKERMLDYVRVLEYFWHCFMKYA